ncbi:MAG: ABC transporter permease subunit [Pseudomonadota bacterium]
MWVFDSLFAVSRQLLGQLLGLLDVYFWVFELALVGALLYVIVQAVRTDGPWALLYQPKTRNRISQLALVIFVLHAYGWIRGNMAANLEDANRRTGFDFLNETASFQILTTPGTWLMSYEPGTSTYWDVFLVGVTNTLAVAVIGVIAATLLGFVLGVFRLSSNVVLRGFATVYIELLRNLPLLLQLFIWYKVFVDFLPSRRGDPWSFFGGALTMDKSGLRAPFPLFGEEMIWVLAALLLAVVGAIGLSRWARLREERTGLPFPSFWVGLGVIVAAPLLTFWALGSPLEWEQPQRTRFGFRDGSGLVMKPEFLAIWLGLTLYTAAFIAEIVRAGILAVHQGQTEAANALGLRSQQTLNLIVIPQALRVIIPPLTSQYLNLTKNSSLAVAIGYTDLYSLSGTINQKVGQEVEIIIMIMAVYLFFSLSISILMNLYNQRIALVER